MKVVLKIVNNVEYLFLACLMIATTALLFTNVMLRYFFDSALFWAEETLRYCIVWITFIGTATCIREQKHISLDVLMTVLRRKNKRILTGFVQGAVTLSSLVLLYLSFEFVMKIKISGQVSATIGGVPMYIIYSCIPLGFLLTSIRSIQVIVHTFGRRIQDGTAAEDGEV